MPVSSARADSGESSYATRILLNISVPVFVGRYSVGCSQRANLGGRAPNLFQAQKHDRSLSARFGPPSHLPRTRAARADAVAGEMPRLLRRICASGGPAVSEDTQALYVFRRLPMPRELLVSQTNRHTRDLTT